MYKNYHSIILDRDKCTGCTTCISTCPTEAIRVRQGKAVIMDERCIDCGVCLRSCPSHAKQSISDPLTSLKEYDFTVALPAPTLYGQFNVGIGINKILTGLKQLGFDAVYEVAEAAELVAKEVARYTEKEKSDVPLISSSCPVVVRLIQNRFSGLTDQIIPVEAPMEIAARIVKEELYSDKGKVGVFFISPCAAKVTNAHHPLGVEKSAVDGVISIREIYLPLVTAMAELTEITEKSHGIGDGVAWAVSEGEGTNVGCPHMVAVDGIQNVVKVFEEIENRQFRHFDFIEAMACPGGCVGGPLTVENPFIAKARIRQKVDALKSTNREAPRKSSISMNWEKELIPQDVMQLDDDFQKAIEKMDQMETLTKELPGLDCGSCGAPTCRALAEDIVRDLASKKDCIFILKDQIKALSQDLADLGAWSPASMEHENK